MAAPAWAIQLATSVPPMSLQTGTIKSFLHKAFRRVVWLSGLGFQLYLGLASIDEISIHFDPAFTMTVCGPSMTNLRQRYIIMAGIFSALFALVLMIGVTMSLQASFYWAWDTNWKDYRLGRTAHWMCGPIEENDEMDLEKAFEPYSTFPQSVEDPKFGTVQPLPYSNTAPPASSPTSPQNAGDSCAKEPA